MVILFYIIGFVFFLYEIGNFINPKSYLKKVRTIEKKNEETSHEETGFSKKNAFDFGKEEDKAIARMFLFNLSYFAWTVVGALFATQWWIFLSLMLFGTSMGIIRKLYKNKTRRSIRLIKFDAFVSACIIMILILNHFHRFI